MPTSCSALSRKQLLLCTLPPPDLGVYCSGSVTESSSSVREKFGRRALRFSGEAKLPGVEALQFFGWPEQLYVATTFLAILVVVVVMKGKLVNMSSFAKIQ